MVESTCLSKLEAIYGGSERNAPRRQHTGTSSVRSDLCRDRSKLKRADPAGKPLARTPGRPRAAHRLDTIAMFPMFHCKHLSRATASPRCGDPFGEIEYLQTDGPCRSKGTQSSRMSSVPLAVEERRVGRAPGHPLVVAHIRPCSGVSSLLGVRRVRRSRALADGTLGVLSG